MLTKLFYATALIRTKLRPGLCTRRELAFSHLNGGAGYINLLDAFNSWQLVHELSQATAWCSSSVFQACDPMVLPLACHFRSCYEGIMR